MKFNVNIDFGFTSYHLDGEIEADSEAEAEEIAWGIVYTHVCVDITKADEEE